MRTALASRVADDILNGLRRKLKVRAEKLCSTLSAETRFQIVHPPLGGYFVWIKFPDSVDSQRFLEFCEGKVKFMPGWRCDATGSNGGDMDLKHKKVALSSLSSHARLCFADLDLELIDKGTKELILCFRQYMLTFES
jgi:DNA-binding transcriptional MocR family regulator